MTEERHSRTVLLLGKEKVQKLRNSHVLIAGLGGVGGYAVEQLARAGISKFTLIDADSVQESNINRQIIALNSTRGKDKVDAFSDRLKDINPDIQIKGIKKFLKEDIIEQIFDADTYNYVIDAIDTLAPKVSFIKACIDRNLSLVSSMGAGGRKNPEKVEITDISKTYNCGLARMLRKRLHKLNIRTGFKAVFSSEKMEYESIVIEESTNKKTNAGTVSYMPAIFGILCASVVIRDLTNSENQL